MNETRKGKPGGQGEHSRSGSRVGEGTEMAKQGSLVRCLIRIPGVERTIRETIWLLGRPSSEPAPFLGSCCSLLTSYQLVTSAFSHVAGSLGLCPGWALPVPRWQLLLPLPVPLRPGEGPAGAHLPSQVLKAGDLCEEHKGA